MPKDDWMGENLPPVFIDYRERKRIPIAKRKFMFHHFDMEVKSLLYGDYVCGNTVVEWKSAQDFVGSITDNRLKRESIEQANNYPYHFVIIAGDMRSAMNYIKYRTKNSKTYNMQTYYKIVASMSTYTNIIITKGTEEGFNIMCYLFKYCNDTGRRNIVPVDKLTNNSAFNYLRSIKRVGDKRSADICTELNISTHKDLMKLTRKDLQGVKGVGRNISKLIMEELGHEKKK